MILDELVKTYARGDRGITHLLAVRDGRIVAEWYRPGRRRMSPHMLHSAAKSFVSTGIGMAVEEGKLTLDDRLVDFLTRDQVEKAVPGVEQLSIGNMLTMRTGHREGTSGVVWRTLDTSWVDAYLQVPITGTPGRDFVYSSGTSHMLSMCLQRATGLPADEYLQPRLFEPLEFSKFTWDRDPDGISCGGNGLTINVLDFVKWGQLYLNGGEWNGRRIVGEDWINASLTRHVDVGTLVWTGDGFGSDNTTPPGEGEGYGYQIWNRPGGSYASGIFGQYCVIVPEANTVVAVFSSITSKEADPLSLDLINASRSSAFGCFTAPLTDNLLPGDEPGDAEAISAMLTGTFVSDDGGTALAFEVIETPGGAALRVQGHDRAGALEFTAGMGHAHHFVGPLGSPSLHHSYTEVTPAFASLERVGPWSVEVRVTYPVTPFEDQFSFTLQTDGVVTYSRRVNVNSQGTGLPEVALRRLPS